MHIPVQLACTVLAGTSSHAHSCTMPAQGSWGRGVSLTGCWPAEHCTARVGQLLQGCQLRREGPCRDADGLSGRLLGAAAACRAGSCCCLDQALTLRWGKFLSAEAGWQCSSLEYGDFYTRLGIKLLVRPGSQAACQTPWSALLLCPRTHANPSADLATIWWGCIISAHDPFERHDKLLPRCIPCSKC